MDTQTSVIEKLSKRQSIGKVLLVWIVLFSSLMTVVLSGIQLYIDYQVELDTIETRLHEIENSYKGSIEASLWNVDVRQLEIQLEGIKRLPDVQSVIIEEKQNIGSAIFLQKGNSGGQVIERQYDLIHVDGADTIHIGTLYIEVSLKAVYRRLVQKALTIMLVQGVKTFFVSLFILYLFYRLVTRHIIFIEHFLNHVDLRNPFRRLVLRRTDKKEHDELDKLVESYNAMSVNLRDAYDEVKNVNHELEQDIVARKKAEAEVKLLNEELEDRVEQRTAELQAANNELNSFCYSVSHDLRAPIRRVEGFRRNFMASYGGQIDEQGQHYLQRMEAGIVEMNEMIDSFLKLSKSTSFELKMAEVNLSHIALRVISKLHERDQHRHVTVDIQPDVYTDCDSRLMELLLTNLLDNAWKYTSHTHEPYISFYVQSGEQEPVFVIEDNGVGFDMDFAKNLFAPFTRLHPGEEFQGTGIGLATVKRIVSRHGGSVWAESAVDRGSKFFFTLKSVDVTHHAD